MVYDELSAEENLLFFAKLLGVSDRQARVRELLSEVGLSERKDSLVRTFSEVCASEWRLPARCSRAGSCCSSMSRPLALTLRRRIGSPSICENIAIRGAPS